MQRQYETSGAVPKCPDCLIEFSDFDSLGRHMERHAPVEAATFSPRGRPLSQSCPKGCGRHFEKAYKLREHARRCNGETPLPMRSPATATLPAAGTDGETTDERKEATMPKCELCDREFGTDHGLEVHKARTHKAAGGGGAPARRKAKRRRPARRRAARTGPALRAELSASGDGAGLVEQLRAKARDLRERADKIDELAEQAQGLF
jgi:hypothetical protein